MIFGLFYFCVVILCVNRSRSSFILYRIVKRHSRQSNVRRIWTCADNGGGAFETDEGGPEKQLAFFLPNMFQLFPISSSYMWIPQFRGPATIPKIPKRNTVIRSSNTSK